MWRWLQGWWRRRSNSARGKPRKPIKAEFEKTGLAKAGSQSRGQFGEALAAEFLQSKSLRVLARNVRCAMGELDLVCQDGDEIVFVEVKTRSSSDYGEAWEFVDEAKQARLIKAARYYCYQQNVSDQNLRFDIVEVILEVLTKKQTSLRWWPNAFDASEEQDFYMDP